MMENINISIIKLETKNLLKSNTNMMCFKCSMIIKTLSLGYTPFTRTKIIQIRDLDSYLDCYLDRDPEVVPVYTGHSLFNTTKRITLFFIVQPMLHRNPDNIGIKVI